MTTKPTSIHGTAVNSKTGKTRPVSIGMRTAEKAMFDGVCPAADGCRVEPDGHCQHGWPSKLLAVGVI